GGRGARWDAADTPGEGNGGGPPRGGGCRHVRAPPCRCSTRASVSTTPRRGYRSARVGRRSLSGHPGRGARVLVPRVLVARVLVARPRVLRWRQAAGEPRHLEQDLDQILLALDHLGRVELVGERVAVVGVQAVRGDVLG